MGRARKQESLGAAGEDSRVQRNSIGGGGRKVRRPSRRMCVSEKARAGSEERSVEHLPERTGTSVSLPSHYSLLSTLRLNYLQSTSNIF